MLKNLENWQQRLHKIKESPAVLSYKRALIYTEQRKIKEFQGA